MKYTIIIPALLLAFPASAHDSRNQSNVNVRANADAEAEAGAYAGSQSNNSVSYRDRLQAPAIGAPGLAAGDCMGSMSGGISVAGFGVSGGKTMPNILCNLRAMGMNDVAVAVMCRDSEVHAAMEATGRIAECKGMKPDEYAKGEPQPFQANR